MTSSITFATKFFPTFILLVAMSQGCALSSLGNRGRASRETEIQNSQKQKEKEIDEDSQRSFQALIDPKTLPSSVELWRPTDKLSLWTPKGDAVFWAGQGAILDFEKKTVQYIEKTKSGALQSSSVMNLSDDVWITWLEVFAKLNKVDGKIPDRTCSSALLEGQEHLILNYESSNAKTSVINFRAPTCKAEFTDTVSLDRLFRWLENHGAPWA